MTEQRNMAQEQADAYAKTLDEIWDTIDGLRREDCADCDGVGTVDGEDCEACDGTGDLVATEYEGRDPFEYLDEMPLEIVWEKGEPFAVVLGTGGPHTEITGGGRSGGYDLWSYWGGDKGRRSSDSIRRTGEYFRDMLEGAE